MVFYGVYEITELAEHSRYWDEQDRERRVDAFCAYFGHNT